MNNSQNRTINEFITDIISDKFDLANVPEQEGMLHGILSDNRIVSESLFSIKGGKMNMSFRINIDPETATIKDVVEIIYKKALKSVKETRIDVVAMCRNPAIVNIIQEN